MANMGYEIFKRFQRLQGGTEAVPSELPTPPDQPPDRGDRLRRYLFNEVRQGVLPDEALAEIKQNPTSLRSLAAYGEGAMSLAMLLSGGKGGEVIKTPRGDPVIFHHGTAHDFVDFNNNTAFFTPDKKAADLYRKRSVFNQHDIELPPDVYGVDELGDVGIDQIAQEEGIDLSKGRILSTPLRLKNTLDLSHLDANFNPERHWDKLHDLGLVEDKWGNLDPEAQQEVADEYGGKAIWKFLDDELHGTIRSKGHDSVKFNDVDTQGNTHETYGIFDPRTDTTSPENYASGISVVKGYGPTHAMNT